MKSVMRALAARSESDSTSHDNLMAKLLIVLFVLVIISTLATGGLLYLRYRRRQREDRLPQYNEKHSHGRANHRRVTTRPTEFLHVYQEKLELMEECPSPPLSPVPEIRITMPEEVDDRGKKQSGKVVIVHVGETGVGLEPYSENLPSYQESESDRFQSLDLERIGGLVEKAPAPRRH